MYIHDQLKYFGGGGEEVHIKQSWDMFEKS